MHGMTLQELGIKNNDILTAEKLSITETILEVPLVDFRTQSLVPRAQEIFTEWFENYKNKETGLMDDAACARFIHGSTGNSCHKTDNRVVTIINKYDGDKDGSITLQEFLKFYYDGSSGPTLKVVQSNLKHHNVRLDLKKFSEVVDEVDYAENEMPRFTISDNQ